MRSTLGTVTLDWRPAERFARAEYPPDVLIEDAADADELLVIMAAIGATDRARRTQASRLAAFDRMDVRTGEGAADAMTPFLYPSRGRFSTPGAGAFYAAGERATALAEVLYHRQRELRESGVTRAAIELRHLHSDLELEVVDTRGTETSLPELYVVEPDECDAARAFADERRRDGARGILYDSVRRRGGECVAVFRPRDVGIPVRQEGTVRLDWTALSGWRGAP